MTTAPHGTTGYRVLQDCSDRPRISAVDADGVEICGAYQPNGQSYWLVYTTASVTTVTGLRPPRHAHLLGRSDARAWVETVGALYSHAAA